MAPFLKSANHALFEDPLDEDDLCDVDVEDLVDSQRGKRKRKKARKWLLPAGIRLGKILVVVQIEAEPSSLPLPTLSKASGTWILNCQDVLYPLTNPLLIYFLPTVNVGTPTDEQCRH